MPTASPKAALDDFLARARRVIRCVADAEVRGSGHTIGQTESLQVIPRGGARGQAVPLRTATRQGNLRFAVVLQYQIRVVPNAEADRRFEFDVTRYVFELLDLEDREIFAYHWHPVGISPIRTPHLHVSGVITLARPDAPKIEIGKAHFPTGPIALEDVIGLLIRDFGIVPRRGDWAGILTT